MSGELVVSKFGGTSMADAQAMLSAAKVSKLKNSTLIVVSATSGTTNQLLELVEMGTKGQWTEAQELINRMRQRHVVIAKELRANTQTLERVEELCTELETLIHGVSLLRECSLKAKDRIQSIGERLSSAIFTQAMLATDPSRPVELLDAREILRTDDQFTRAVPIIEEMKRLAQIKLGKLSPTGTRYITQGFIGRTEDGETTTLGRGGSDYSASLFAEAVGATICEIWTDVDGIASTDPRLCPKARPIREISFQEAAEMAVFGAKVLHPTTLTPARRAGIPVFVGSTFDPQGPGTWVRNECQERPLVRALALKKAQALVTISTPKMLNAYGFLASIFTIFAEHKVAVDAITTSEISVSMTLDEGVADNRHLIRDLSALGEVKVERGFSLVSLIGNNINHTPGLARSLFEVLENVNIRMICQGASVHNCCFLVASRDAEAAICGLHARFLEKI